VFIIVRRLFNRLKKGMMRTKAGCLPQNIRFTSGAQEIWEVEITVVRCRVGDSTNDESRGARSQV